MIENLKEMLDIIRLQRLKYYNLLPFSLDNARNNEEIAIAGSYLYVLKLDGLVTIRLNEMIHDEIDLLKYRQINSPFYRIFLTHPAQPGKSLLLAVGVTSEVFNVQDFESPDISSMSANIDDLTAFMKTAHDVNYGTQVSKSNIASNATVIIHTVSPTKTFLLEFFSLFWSTAISSMWNKLIVRNELDIIQYAIFQQVSLSSTEARGQLSGSPKLIIPSNYDICISSDSASNIISCYIKGREF